MLEAMRSLALDYLFQELGNGDTVQDIDAWYVELRQNRPQDLFPFLVEDVSNIEKIYILSPDKTDTSLVNLDVVDMTAEIARKLPFKQYRARAIGPIIKRSESKDGISPNSTTQQATLKYFKKVGESSLPWASYFKEIFEILDRPRIKTIDHNVITLGEDNRWSNVYSAALDLIPTTKGTVIVTVADTKYRWPGERAEYLNYLTNELSEIKYCTGETPAKVNQVCPLCLASDVKVYPNALRGAGINFINADREGVFPSIQTSNAWKKYALCGNCADLLFIYKFHVLKPKKANGSKPFVTRIAGVNALVIPYTTADLESRKLMMRHVEDFINDTKKDVEETEENLLDILKKEKAILNMTFLWATVGQNIEDVTGAIVNVPPSRLQELSRLNEGLREALWQRRHPLFPTILAGESFYLTPDLSLSALRSLFYRPGKDAKAANSSKQLFELKRELVEAVYHKQNIPEKRFWDELILTAKYHWRQATDKGDAYGLLHEGQSKKGAYLTTCGWIRYLAWWLFYFKKLEVMDMDNAFYEPAMEELAPYFGPESGINSAEKAYAFLLGVLYGKVLEVQGARGVNISSNALTWLKRLTLRGSDLPQLYIKIREKLLAYETEKSAKVRLLLTELGLLGVKLGDPIELGEVQTNYYLLLGQSMATTILKKERVTESE